MNGYFGIGLHQPKNPINVGSVLRAAHCFGAAFVATSGRRYKRAASDTSAAYKRIPLHQVEDLRELIPFDCVPIAVDLVPGAVRLCDYQHPARAFYVFGPEDGTLASRTLSWCRDVVVIPAGCLNLAMAATCVLYDRTAKLLRAGQSEVPGASARRLKVV